MEYMYSSCSTNDKIIRHVERCHTRSTRMSVPSALQACMHRSISLTVHRLFSLSCSTCTYLKYYNIEYSRSAGHDKLFNDAQGGVRRCTKIPKFGRGRFSSIPYRGSNFNLPARTRYSFVHCFGINSNRGHTDLVNSRVSHLKCPLRSQSGHVEETPPHPLMTSDLSGVGYFDVGGANTGHRGIMQWALRYMPKS